MTSVSMRLSSKNSIARRCIGLKLSANIGVLQRRWPAMCARRRGSGRCRKRRAHRRGRRAGGCRKRRNRAAVAAAPGGSGSVGVRHELRAVAPQPAQVEVEQALVVDQQGAVPLALQHGAAVGRLQAEVVALPLGMIG
jgi:hypothetical protein